MEKTAKLLLGARLRLRAAGKADRLSKAAHELIEAAENELIFSTASLWEIIIKRGLGHEDFQVDARLLWPGLLDRGYSELPIASEQMVAIDILPTLHKETPSIVSSSGRPRRGITLLTAVETVARYPAPVRAVGGVDLPKGVRF